MNNTLDINKLSLSDLVKLKDGGIVLDVENDDIPSDEEDQRFLSNIPMTNDEIFNALNIDDENEDTDSSLKCTFYALSFDTLRNKMNDILGNSKLLKLVRRKGVGDIIPFNCQVKIKYLGFFEYHDEPFDSTFAHGSGSVNIRLNQGNLIPGLELGIATMQKHETSLFLIHPDLAFGQLGCMPRILPNSEVLFVVQLVDFLDNALADTYENLTLEEKKSFSHVMPRVRDILNSAKDSFKRKRIKQAIREYIKAINWLENTALENQEEEDEMNKHLSRACTNLAVCYNLENKPRQACNACNRNPIPSSKSYFNHGRALARIGEYDEAMKKLQKSLSMTSDNNQIVRDEIAYVNDQITKYRAIEKKLWSNCLKVTKEKKVKTEFEKAAEEMCETFVRDIKLLRQPIPEGLTPDEEKCLRAAAAARGLSITNHTRFGKEIVYLNKSNY